VVPFHQEIAMNEQSIKAGVALVARRLTRALADTPFPALPGGGNLRRYDARGDAKGTSGEIAWGVALFVLAAVILLWLHVQFGVQVASVE